MSQRVFLVASITTVVLLVILSLAYNTRNPPELTTLQSNADPKIREMVDLAQKLIKQRNDIAKDLNQKQQKLGQIACEKIEKVREATSETGGWCQSSSKENSGHHMTDLALAAELAEFFKGKTVGSFGDGPGRYKQLLLDSGKVKSYDAYDGAPYCDKTSEGRVKFLDLTLQQYGIPLYDWVMSLEVAEHIPPKYESVYIDNILRHAREGVVISWAVPGQGGYSHVNNRSFNYVVDLMNRHGFSYDEKASNKFKSVAKFAWFKRNTSVFRRHDLTQIDKESPFFT